jgi:excisionase family DNA binding protein
VVLDFTSLETYLDREWDEAMDTSNDELLTPQELAALLRLPLGTIRKQRAEGTGPPGFRIGKHVRWRRGDVMKWLEQQREKDLRR